MKIYCCDCEQDVDARLTNGREIYPGRYDLYSIPFWKCDKCGNFVGCHYKTEDKTRPLGCIPDAELRKARKYIHSKIDSLWVNAGERSKLYRAISNALGYKYHTAQIRTVDQALKVCEIVEKLEQRNE